MSWRNSPKCVGLALILAIGASACASDSTPTNPTPSSSTSTSGSGAGSAIQSLPTAADLAFCVTETNRYRAQVNVRALTGSSDLDTFAAAGAIFDQHAKSPHAHFLQQNSGIAHAENEVLTGSTITLGRTVQSMFKEAIALFWQEGPGGGHYENVRGGWSAVGCGVAVSGTQVTVVQDFR